MSNQKVPSMSDVSVSPSGTLPDTKIPSECSHHACLAVLGHPVPSARAPQLNAPGRRRASLYALKNEISRTVKAVAATGIAISSIDLRPDGTIRLTTITGAAPADESEFDR